MLRQKAGKWSGTVTADLATAAGVDRAYGLRARSSSTRAARHPDQQPRRRQFDAVRRHVGRDLGALVRSQSHGDGADMPRARAENGRARESGAVVNTGSDLAKQPEPGFVDYGTCKAGLLYLTKALAKQYAPTRARQHACCPGRSGRACGRRPGGIVDQLVDTLRARSRRVGEAVSRGSPDADGHRPILRTWRTRWYFSRRRWRNSSPAPVSTSAAPYEDSLDGTLDYSSFGLQDKIAIVTGASQGIGRAIALGLAQAGAHVVLAKHPERTAGRDQEVQAEIEALGRKRRSSCDRRRERRAGPIADGCRRRSSSAASTFS